MTAVTLPRLARVARQVGHELAVRIPSRRLTLDPNSKVIVCLTTYPARLGAVSITIESLLRQSHRPRALVLVLSRSECRESDLPSSVVRQQQRGLTVLWVDENIRSYKKLLPILENEPKATIVTADDDVLYAQHWLASLVQASQQTPHTVIGHRGSEMLVRESELLPYRQWPVLNEDVSGMRVFLTGMGGILYPPDSLASEVLDYPTAQGLCPNADDVWFKAMAMMTGTSSRVLATKSPAFRRSWRANQRHALYRGNLVEQDNDRQLRDTFAHFGLASMLTSTGPLRVHT